MIKQLSILALVALLHPGFARAAADYYFDGPIPRQVLENYWKGVLLVPERATDLHLQILGCIVHRDPGLGGPGVAVDVVQRLLVDAEKRQAELFGEAAFLQGPKTASAARVTQTEAVSPFEAFARIM